VENYTSWKPLSYPMDDAEAIAKDLKEFYGFEVEIVRDPDKKTIQDKLLEYTKRSFAGDAQLLVYFSGHGSFSESTKEGFIVPRDGKQNDTYQDSYFPHDRLKKAVDAIPCNHILLAIDACFSGTLDDRIAQRNDGKPVFPKLASSGSGELLLNSFVEEQLKYKTRFYITSGGKEQTPDKSQFARQILEALRSTTSENRVLTFNGLCTFLERAIPLPRAGEFGTPEPGVKNFLFVRKENTPAVSFNLSTYEQKQKDLQAWKSAQAANTPQAYQTYLSGFPDGAFRSEAAKALLDAEDELEWEIAKARNTPEGYQAYLRKYPSGKHAAEAGTLSKRPDPVKTTPAAENPPPTTSTLTDADLRPYNMVRVRGGTFTMGCTSEQGSDCYDREKPAHQVTVSDFYIGKYEVTQKEWREVMGSNPSYFKNCDECPVETVSWDDIQSFLSKLNAKTGRTYRLPTEAEWEYAARGGSASRGYKYAGSNSLDEVAWYTSNSGSKTHPVGQKKANELGLYDMSGNVWEWCADDWHSNYSGAPSTGRAWIDSPRASYRVFRGGSWIDIALFCRVSYRFDSTPSYRGGNLGFRLAL